MKKNNFSLSLAPDFHFASHRPLAWASAFALGLPCSALAGGIQTLEEVQVTASAEGLTGIAASSSEGTVTASQLENRPLLRPAEVLETVPGLVVTQHSGDGKANQYFLRGFNLDHGTDFATYLLGMPVNLPTHAHGQGYTDLNFLIPELVSGIQYRKGPYAAEQGDFSSAGSASIAYKRSLPANTAEIGIGEHGYLRGLAMGSSEAAAGTWLWAVEGFRNDGPWKEPENYRRGNFVLRYSHGQETNGWSASLLGYDGKWNSTDQVPQRAIDSGLIDRYGTLDPSTGGSTSRYAATADWVRTGDDSRSQANVWLTRYRLNLFSNFTYALESPTQGDQFEQADSRTAFGGDARHTIFHELAGRDSDTTVGVQLRQDRIHAGLYRTVAQMRTDKLLADGSMGSATVREDAVRQSSLAVFLENRTQWLPWLRSVAGLRADGYRFDVSSNLAANSGQRRESIASPRLALVFGPWAASELYLNWGHGFHSNDARGATQKIDPADGVTPVVPVDPLVRTRGMEVGLRTQPLPGWQSALSLWRLDAASELLFVGDAGTTEASRPSRRTGIEWTNYWRPRDGIEVDADLAISHARFSDDDPAGNQIPGAVGKTASVGISADDGFRWSGGVRLRYVGSRPLVEDNSVRAEPSLLANLRLGYRVRRGLQLIADVLNLTDRKVSDIEYFYLSRLPGEAAATNDVHLHPAEPRTFRLALRADF